MRLILRNTRFFLALACIVLLAGCRPKSSGIFHIGPSSEINTLHAPWDGLDDNTVFRCFSDSEWFWFVYDVQDTTLTLTEDFQKERDVDPEDRVEIFFSPREEMDIYWCAEMDPKGRVMDYEAKYYRDFDYDWDFQTLEVAARIKEDGYTLWGRVSKEELRNLGVDLNCFRMGVFRADFKQVGPENWYSAVPTADKSPDFHKPDLLFTASML